jgi:MoaA/NifB/PqqE/SkfB family radical SAM enzyme
MQQKISQQQPNKFPTDTFCILPWIHFFHEPDGKITPCCSANKQQVTFGNLQDFDTVDELINSPGMLQVRKDMLANKQSIACSNCYRQESHGLESFRLSKNSDVDGIDIAELLANTDADGTLHNFKMQYWDARFSNICNLKCRMCGPGYSHSWAQEVNKKVNGSYIIQAHKDTDSWDDIIARYGDLSKLREVYFAGGEVFFQQEHWQMLEHLKRLERKDMRLTYVTNLTRLSMGEYKIEDYLTYFTNVLFIISMDGIDKVFEYIRSGSDWEKFTANITAIQKFNVKIRFNIVITVYNILQIDQILAFIDSLGIKLYDLTVANDPRDQNITNLPDELKTLAINRIKASPHYSNRLDAVISYMQQPPVASWNRVISRTRELDATRGENILEVVPEFAPYWS